ncbi:MAG: UDP-N-acetylmuramoyl-L-alanyl-D-glutamate--2,6-diaminopimelate ligase [Candidatus Omnitrophica bacterium]|nr:UDP-N-acetylmuramoyl-L-alanyl-D-glutamate--2,6-diaminopimelate ligase [Candidatus Omnitrophota bacterium]
MKLSKLIDSLPDYRLSMPLEDFEVKGISCNSKDVGDNFVFVAIKGTTQDGHNFIPEAVFKGAKAIVIQGWQEHFCDIKSKTQFIEVRDTHLALARLAAKFYDNPSQKIKVIGITGTNGKTTISYLIEAFLKKAGLNVGVIGTINYRFKDTVLPSRNTTPGPLEIQSLLNEMLRQDTDYVIMEVSSHALDQQRTEGISFYSGIFSNLTHDHLDYHSTMEDYFQAKAKLFLDLAPNTLAVINNDDTYGRRLKALTKAQIVTYGIDNPADVMAEGVYFDITHTEFLVRIPGRKVNLKTQLIGEYNIYNILASLSWALKEGLELDLLKSALEKFDCIPGRLERVNTDRNRDFSVFIDYAHTEDALRNVIMTLRKLPHNKILVVFGCGGERDKTKRPKMGQVVSELADYAIITNDNPRSENPLDIIEDIKRGIRKNNYSVIPDRLEAIRRVLSISRKGDIILIAGKGHENYQILKEGRIHFEDREVVQECLRSMI